MGAPIATLVFGGFPGRIDRWAGLLRVGGMSRSVVLRDTPRCARCQLAPRWCICAGHRAIESVLRVDVMMHFMECYRPSSTGHLIKRVLPDSGQHVYRKERLLEREVVVQPDRELWILHPQGEPMPTGADPKRLQVLLLDASWVQATEMAHSVAKWGRRVRLPMQGHSRYWLRAQADAERFSTVESLLFLMEALGLREAHAALRAQFELHVWASLCARGHKARAREFLVASPVPTEFPDLLARLAPRVREWRA